ncbi:retrovirus-related Pol polyprotein from transposon opus [Trichonephila clavipes]|nr:retrovirus-related Pol polyprotein from transposon opus [Trichonephila clavipes]
MLKISKAEFTFLIETGICRSSNRPWVCSLHMVKKKDDNWRPCGDYRSLNTITRPDRYIIPHLHDFTHQLAGCQIFSTSDLPSDRNLYMITCAVSTGQFRPYIPAVFRREIFERYHRTSHPVIRSSVKLISKKYFWPSLGRDVTTCSQGCIECQKCKVSRHLHSEIGTHPVVSKRFDELHLGIIRTLPTASVLCHYTRSFH